MSTPGLSLQARPATETRLSPKLWGRVKLANFLDLPDEQYRGLVRGLETDPLFTRLASVANPEERIFSRRRFPGTDIASRACEFHEEFHGASLGAADLTPLLDRWRGLWPCLQKIGLERFKRCFLYEEEGAGPLDAADACGITQEEAQNIRHMLDDVCLLQLAQPAASAAPPAGGSNVQVAAIELDNEKPRLAYLSIPEARGCYVINYKKLYDLHRAGKFSSEEFRRIRGLIRTAELVNTRRTALNRILERIVGEQAEYFRTRRARDLRPLTQQMLARELAVHRSTVHRAVEGKSLILPWGEDKNLKFFLVNRKSCTTNLIGELTESGDASLSDEALRRLLWERYSIRLARRTVCSYRRQLRGRD
jgi:hypothetical protein